MRTNTAGTTFFPSSLFTPHRLRTLLACLLVLIAAGGIPGASSRAILYELALPPVPDDVRDRDGVVELEVRDPSGNGIPRAHARAIAIVEGRAYLADARDTDSAGHARLAGLPRGELWLLTDAQGRARGSTHLVLDGGSAGPPGPGQDPGQGVRHETIVLGPEHSIAVVVKDDRGAGVEAEVRVTSRAERLPVGARTGTDGVARVGRLGDGPWVVTALAPGLEEATGHAAADGETITLVLRKLGGLAVHVVGPGAEPAQGARVEVAGAALWPPRAAETDARGDVHVGGLAAGAYALRATRGDLASPIELGVLLDRGEEKAVTLRLAPGSWVAVRVLEGDADDAEPVARASVTLAEAGLSPFPLEATTDARGRARLGPIAPGSATLSARADGFVARGAVAITAPVAGETRVALARAGTLTGRVVDGRGFPVDGATIEIVGTDLAGMPIVDDPRRSGFQAAQFTAMLAGPAPLQPAGELGVVPGPVPAIPHGPHTVDFLPGLPIRASLAEPWVTRDDGTFRASPATPGRIRAIVRHPQYVEAQSDVVALAPGAEAHVDVILGEGGALEGRVLDARDRPVPGARLTAAALRGALERVTHAASDGTFAFAALPDTVVLTAGDDRDDLVRMEVAVPERGRREVTIHLPPARDPLEVTVVDDRDSPVDAAQVSATSLSPEEPLRQTAFTDARGAASLRRASGLDVRVEVSAPGRAPKVVQSGGAAELRIVLAAAETATGEVVSRLHREAVSDAEVTLYTELGVRRVHTSADGSFTLTGLAPGLATLRVRGRGLAPFEDGLTVPDSGGRRPFEIPRVELEPEGIAEGDVFDAMGKPVAGARVARDHVPTWLVAGTRPAAGDGFVLSDAHGHFVLGELPEGTVTLEAYAPDAGRGQADGVKIVSGRTTSRLRIDLRAPDAAAREPMSTGSVAVTLGETAAPVEVRIVSVMDGSEAERAGLAPGDTIVSVDGAPVASIEEARAKLSGPIADDVIVEVRRGAETKTLRVSREAVRR
jgi:hypothetical protein